MITVFHSPISPVTIGSPSSLYAHFAKIAPYGGTTKSALLGQSISHRKHVIQSSGYTISAFPFFILKTSHIHV